MANDWTRLLQEASKHHGPDGLRAFYAKRGRLEGIGGTLLLVGGVTLLAKAKRSFTKAKAATAMAHDTGLNDNTSRPNTEAYSDDDDGEGTAPEDPSK